MPDVHDMLAAVREDFARTAYTTGIARPDECVLQAMARVPRERFVSPQQAGEAYENRALPIGMGQTISQPFIVALMTHLLEPRPEHVVLEVGTGSGYQAAVLAELVRRVYTIEIIDRLARQAARRLQALGYDNVVVERRDGHAGWPEHAPFDGILVAAATAEAPQPLIDQLAGSGRLVIPLRQRFWGEELTRISRNARGQITRRAVLPVAFVPFTAEEAGDR